MTPLQKRTEETRRCRGFHQSLSASTAPLRWNDFFAGDSHSHLL